MDSVVIKPKESLADYVELIYSNEAEEFNYHGLSSPSINSEIFFSFGDYFSFANYSIEKGTTELSSISKNQLYAIPVNAKGYHSTSGIILKPWAFLYINAIDGKSTYHLSQQTIISELKKQLVHLEKDLKISSMEDKSKILYSFVKNKISFKEINPTFTKIYSAINAFDKNVMKIEDLVAFSHISQKTFIEIFKAHIGINPLKYLQFRAIEYSLKKLQDPYLTLSQIALDSGFYDQSHFNRVFKGFMQMTPNQYRLMQND
ncbi:helix-turn-helix domain-containing protein [Pontibacter cellulosilyticus]|uniref:Helix-turn-helix transcriptional regulator n=1 Tax=Pontibacter cellulosilyticus TaxID=1720253 RepID=A0A923N416_9BACT|nr:AraC family transcriptional regulator [Pontibacter cellulosilyticus]MBC5991774.1 helix-turn-helix transcriptional regulator [Pontibacter cellulosilyticus]